LIDLHTHTTASDGRCSPTELVARAAAADVDVLSVTDHDTTASTAAASSACTSAGIEFVPGIEITAVVDGRDVHVLGYFIDPDSASFAGFLAEQRRRRLDRVRQIIDRLKTLGVVLDPEAVLQPGRDDTTKAAGRPWIARALVAGGHVADTTEAFDRFLATGRPAFVARIGPSPMEVFARIHESRGIASLAHPGLIGRDDLIPGFARAGLDAIEAHHSRHAPDDTQRYLAMADEYGLAVSGGSDYHADPSHDAGGPGSVSLPPAAFQVLKDRCAARRATASGAATSS
jgi:predicted metal-dependent phosphoesterase TrpH